MGKGVNAIKERRYLHVVYRGPDNAYIEKEEMNSKRKV